jgi:protein ImuB
MRLVALDPSAGRLGLSVGLSLSDARARVPDLNVFDHDPAADRCLLEQLAASALRYTPMVAIDSPDGLVLDIGGCAHLFGGEQELADDAGRRLAAAGMTSRMALAGTSAAARALARYPRLEPDEAAAIRALPVAALELEEDAGLALMRAGLKSVGDMAVRPMAGLAARFGGEAVERLRHLLGEVDRPIVPIRPPAPVTTERRFAEPVARTEYALSILSELVVQAGKTMAQRHVGGRRFEATFFRSDGMTRTLIVETGRPVRDSASVTRLIGERVESLSDPIDPGFGFDLIRLDVPVIEPLDASQLKLEGGSASEMQVAALIDRLNTRLGRERVSRLLPVDTHVPEQAQIALPAVDTVKPLPWRSSEAGEPPSRPLYLFDPPQPIEVIAEVPDGPPHRFKWRRNPHIVRRFEGPERIAAEWWRRKDGAVDRPGLTRDYYRVEDVRGRRFWIFRHGLYEEKPDPRWYLHGLFA